MDCVPLFVFHIWPSIKKIWVSLVYNIFVSRNKIPPSIRPYAFSPMHALVVLGSPFFHLLYIIYINHCEFTEVCQIHQYVELHTHMASCKLCNLINFKHMGDDLLYANIYEYVLYDFVLTTVMHFNFYCIIVLLLGSSLYDF